MKFLALVLSFAMLLSFGGCAERNLGTREEAVSSDMSETKSSASDSEPLNEGQKDALQNESESSEQIMEEPSEQAEPLSLEIDKEVLEGLDSKQIPWGFGPHFNKDDKRSQSCEALMEKYGSKNALFIGPKEKVIYLTFDEGYENGFTAPILDVLKEKGVKGTFFITGDYFNSQKELIRRIIDEGHTLGSHSTKHLDFAQKSIDECYEDLTLLHENVRDEFDYEMRYFRFPAGSFSERSLEMVNQMGYTSVFWSFGYKDWDPKNQMAPSEALEKLTSSLHEGEILLLHPVGSTNAEILGDLIDEIKSQGFEIRALGQ